MSAEEAQLESTPISKRNLLEKMRFIVSAADGPTASMEDLERSLRDYLLSTGERQVTRQAISLWASGRSVPSRSAAFSFLLGFLNESVLYESLSPDQKKVLKRVTDFLRQSLAGIHDRRPGPKAFDAIQVTKARAVLLAGAVNEAAYEQCARAWAGVYLAYRMSLLAAEPTIVQEVVRIRKIHNRIQYQHWYLRDGVDLEHYEGAAALLGEGLWLLGVSRDSTRYRFCHFRNNPSMNPTARKFRWGLVHTEVPTHPAHDPASARILLVRSEAETLDFEDFLTQTVRHLSREEVPADLSEVITRSIDNHSRAASEVTSLTPLEGFDPVLRVDQSTLDNFSKWARAD